MTDLHSRLADDILALINAKPQSPTKDEVVALLQSYLFVDGQGTALYKLPDEHCMLPEAPGRLVPETDDYSELMKAYNIANSSMLLAWAEAWERNRAAREEQSKQLAQLIGHATEHINAGDAVVVDPNGWLKRWVSS